MNSRNTPLIRFPAASGRARAVRTLADVWVTLGAVAALVVGVLVGIVAGMTIARRGRAGAPPAGGDSGGPNEAGSQPARPGDARSHRARMVAAPSPEEELSSDVIDLLANLRSITIVVDESDKVVFATAQASAIGIVRGTELAHEMLRTLVRGVRLDDEVRDLEVQLSRGPLGPGRLDVGIRAMPFGLTHVLLLLDDNTQARRVEEVRRDFMVNVSHELKTPVGGLTLLAEAVDEARDDPAAVHRFAKRMRKETTRLARLVQEIVELSRLQVADTFDTPQLVDVRGCVREAVEHVQLLAEDKGITITAGLGNPAVRAQVYGDAHLITTAVRNLVENAVNYSGENTRVAVTIDAGRDLVKVIVKDQGSGIPAADLDRIFERFYRVDPARSRRTGGTGLGLAIVKHITANHGGDITVWSEEGHGSTFTMVLPAAHPPDAPSSATPPSDATPSDAPPRKAAS